MTELMKPSCVIQDGRAHSGNVHEWELGLRPSPKSPESRVLVRICEGYAPGFDYGSCNCRFCKKSS